jgi:HEPN domain-containing protein
LEKEEVIDYWIESSDRDFLTSKSLMELKHYPWALFIAHLVIEKLLKAYYIKVIDANVPFTHDLNRIAEKSNLKLSEEMEDLLDVISTFNIRARYEDYKQEFYKTCTKEFSEKYFNQIEELREWIKKKL